MLENDILHSSVENLKEATGLVIKVIANPKKDIDALLQIGKNNNVFNIELKREVHKANLPHILPKLIKKDSILIAKTISKSTKNVLEEKNINYLDISGNCFIKGDKGLFILIQGQQNSRAIEKRKFQLFNKNGIKLIYAFLVDETLINKSYSVMAEKAMISKSTIGNILQDLKEYEFLIHVNQNTRKIVNKQDLLTKWVQAYNEKLKPSLLRGKYRFLPNKLSEWKNINLASDTFWGGEPAADILTDYLSPGEWTIYSNQSKNNLIKHSHLVPDPKQGNVLIYSVFWNTEDGDLANKINKIANPILIYADLIGTNDNRNFETARKIYEQELSTYFTE